MRRAPVFPTARSAAASLRSAALSALVALPLVAGLLAAAPSPAQAQAPAASSYADPDRPPRAAATDIDPVQRAGAIDTLATVRKRGTLRVGVALNTPMVFHDSKNELAGFSVELATKLADDLGVKVEFVETSWSQIVADLLERRFDVIASGLWMTLPRALVVNYTAPVATQGLYLFTGRKAANRRDLAAFDQPGTRIVVYAGTVQEQLAARRFPKATLVRVEGDADHFTPVLKGAADAVIVPTFAPEAVLKAAGGKLSLPIAQPLASTSTAMAIRKGDADFLNYLNTWLAIHRAEGLLDERARYWATSPDVMR